MKLVDQLPSTFVKASVDDLFYHVDDKIIIRFDITYFLRCGQMYNGPLKTNVDTNRAMLYSDCKAGRVFFNPSPHINHEH